MDWKLFIYNVIIYSFLLYSVLLILVYGWVGIYAFGAIRKYIRKNSFTDYSLIATSPNAPTFSLIAPAYNEGATIVENVRSLLSLYYNNLEIIIINDGSKDDSLQRLIEAYDLHKVDYFIEGSLPTKEVKGVYKSKNPVFKKLIVVDKENGGKSDALNVGINVATNDYIVCIDVDCILEQDAILKLAKPFMDEVDAKVIACGGVIRLANNCKVENGKIVEVNLPQSKIARAQALEYIRAFVLGRMAWSRLNSLMLISGAFGAFDRSIVLACGGYDHDTVGEDMELIVRMRRYMHEKKLNYKIVNIPDPLCWTEVPESKEILTKQRNRWMRGTIETLLKHRVLFFNPKYGKLGLISYPYWFFFEFLGPIIEFIGFIILIIFLVLGLINWQMFFALFAFIFLYGVLYSIYAILVDLITYNVYHKKNDIGKLILTAFIEPFTFHPMVVKAGVKGVKDFFLNNNAWGEMTRQGFGGNQKNISFIEKLKLGFINLLQQTTIVSVVYLLLMMLSSFGEYYFYTKTFSIQDTTSLLKDLFINNFNFAFDSIFVVSLIYFLIQFYALKWAKYWIVIAYSVLLLGNIGLILYFKTSLNFLGADLFSYSLQEIRLIIGASGVLNGLTIGLGILLIALIVGVMHYFYQKTTSMKFVQYPLLILGCLAFVLPIENWIVQPTKDEFLNSIVHSKSSYFYEDVIKDLTDEQLAKLDFLSNNYQSDEVRVYPNDKDFPFFYKDDNPNFLATHLNTINQKPNIVFIVVEGLGRAFSNDNAYLGSFTPFLDELSKKGLYWENGLSTTGRTYGVLPALTGSLPFAENGFMEQENIPHHINLFNLLKSKGYTTGFFYGGDSEFDYMSKFLNYSHVDQIIDKNDYGNDYEEIPSNNNFSWGFDDHSVFKKYLATQKSFQQPYFNVILTLATHSPFLINHQEKYNQQFDPLIQKNNYSPERLKEVKEYKQQLLTFLSVDEAIKNFFEEYQKRPDYHQTIFVITGDHRMPEVPMETKLDRYHVPIIIYSSMLKSSSKMSNIVSHFDIAPTFHTYLRDTYKLNLPHYVTWIGTSLSNGKRNFRNSGIPMMQNKNILDDFVLENFHLNKNELYKIENNLSETKIEDKVKYNQLKNKFQSFKRKNHSLSTTQKMVPDSILNKYLK